MTDPSLIDHAREMRNDLNAELPNGVGNTIDALCDKLESIEENVNAAIGRLRGLEWKLSEEAKRDIAEIEQNIRTATRGLNDFYLD